MVPLFGVEHLIQINKAFCIAYVLYFTYTVRECQLLFNLFRIFPACGKIPGYPGFREYQWYKQLQPRNAHTKQAPSKRGGLFILLIPGLKSANGADGPPQSGDYGAYEYGKDYNLRIEISETRHNSQPVPNGPSITSPIPKYNRSERTFPQGEAVRGAEAPQ
jgi:hypothetical protein